MSAPIRATVEVPADVQFLGVITTCLEQVLQKQTAPVPPALGHDLQLALQETCVNVMVSIRILVADGDTVPRPAPDPDPGEAARDGAVRPDRL